jgi:DNA polymerase-4
MTREQLNRPVGRSTQNADDVNCHVLHIDMDAFYASVEVRDNPEFVNQPVIIGHSASRGVVLSATYSARKLGVHSAMPMSRAMRLAPNATVLEPNMEKYWEVSEEVMSIFSDFTPLVQQLSVDEAFLDVAGAIKLIGSPTVIGEQIRKRVWQEQRITCSVGVASTMFVAKLATNFAKPNGLHVVPANEVLEFLHPLPITALWGVGAKTAEQLHRLGLRHVSDIANTPLKTLCRALGDSLGQHLHDLAWGRDPRQVTVEHEDQSIGAERTFDFDLQDGEEITTHILELSNKVARRLRDAQLTTKTVSIKVKFSDFSTITRSRTLDTPTDLSTDIYQAAKYLFEKLKLERTKVRLVGVRATGLAQDAPIQLALSTRETGWREAELALDKVAQKFGNSAVRPARLFRADQDPVTEND